MKKELVSILEEGIKQIDPSLMNISAKLQLYYDEIMLFNPSLKLISASEEEVVKRHILDCLAPVNIIKQHLNGKECTFADLGSGSGLPGVVLALALENCEFFLIDRMERRVGFLRNTVVRLGLQDRVKVVQQELEKLDRTFDAVTFRAFRQMEDIYLSLDKITAAGSYVFSFKSSEDNVMHEKQVLDEKIPGVFETETEDYAVPLLDAKRCLFVLKKN